jgi:uncharacterized membrane protein
MSKVLLVLHVLAAIIAIGPVTVAASMFPPAVREAAGRSAAEARSVHTVQLLHRICRRYAVLGLAVPVLGMATAAVALAVVPGIGGMLALRSLPAPQAHAQARTATQTP